MAGEAFRIGTEILKLAVHFVNQIAAVHDDFDRVPLADGLLRIRADFDDAFAAIFGAGGISRYFQKIVIPEVASIAGLRLNFDARPDFVGAMDANKESTVTFGDVPLFHG